MKKIISVLIVLCMCITSTSIFAEEELVTQGACSDSFWDKDSHNGLYWEYKDFTLTISGNGDMHDYWYTEGGGKDGINIVYYSKEWKNFYDDIKKVVIKNGVTSIGVRAFYELENLESVEIASTVKIIYGDAFNSPYLKEVVIPEGVEIIGGRCFNNCTALEKVTIPQRDCATIGLNQKNLD